MRNRDLGNIYEVFLNNGDQVNLLWFYLMYRLENSLYLIYQVAYSIPQCENFSVLKFGNRPLIIEPHQLDIVFFLLGASIRIYVLKFVGIGLN